MKNIKITQSITNRQDASLGMFFKDISKIPLLDIEEEIELSKRIQNGDTSAINKLVEGNLRFVVSVAKQYQNKGLPLVDLIQEGVSGALEAAAKWDHTRGFKFISYAVWWIRQAIVHAISDQCRTVRVPMNQIVNMNKINKVIDKFEQEHSRKPFAEEIENEVNIRAYKINQTLSSVNRSISIDSPFNDENDDCLLDIIPNSDESDDDILQDEKSNKLNEILNNLSYRERDVIRMSFGINMEVMQNEEIASRFGIGTERVRQIQKEAIDKLRLNYSNELKELL